MRTLTLSIIAVFTLCIQCHAGGSVSVEQIQKVLKTQPALAKHLNATLKFADGGGATRLGRHWPLLGGARIAPYTIEVTTKDSDQTRLELTVYCVQIYYDEDDKILPLKDGEITDAIIKKAARIVEKVTSVSLAPAAPAEKEAP